MVGNLSYDTDERSLSAALENFGRIVDVKVVTDRDTGRSRGFGFVTFADPKSASDCVQHMHGRDIDGRACRIEFSEDRRGGGGGGGGGGGYAPSGPPPPPPGGGSGYGAHAPPAPPPASDAPPPPPPDASRVPSGAGAGTRGVCQDFIKGTCTRGDSCRYSHIGGAPPGGGGGVGYGGGGGGGGGAAPGGDWTCDNCGNSNFNWRKSCKKCNKPKSRALKEAEQKASAGWLHAGLDDTSNRIFIQGFDPEKVTEDDLRELFSGIGVIARVRQRHGFPDQWPYSVRIYKDERGEPKGEAVIKYDDPMAAQSAPGFYDGYELKGSKISVSIATKKERPEEENRGGGGGGGGYGGGGGGGGYGGGGGGGGYRGGGGGGGGYGGGGYRGGGYGGDRGYGGGGGGRDRYQPY